MYTDHGLPFVSTLSLCYCNCSMVQTKRHSWWSCHLFRSHWRLRPSRRQKKSEWSSGLSRLILTNSAGREAGSEGAHLGVLPHCCHGSQNLETFESFHDIATATWMTWWNQPGILMHFSLLFEKKKDLLAPLLLFWPARGFPLPRLPKPLFRPVLSFPLLSFVQMRSFFPFFNQSDRPSPPPSPCRPLRTNWAL